MTDYTRKAVRGAGIVFVMMFASYFLGYIFRLLIARELGASSYGLVYGIIALFGFFNIFGTMGLDGALAKYIPEFRVQNKLDKIKGAILITLGCRLLFSAIICTPLIIFSDFIAIEYFNTPNASILIKIYAIGIIFAPIIATIKIGFRGFQTMGYYASIDFVKSIFVLGITFFLLMIGFSEISPILGFTLAFIPIMPLLYFPIVMSKAFPEFPRVKANLSKKLTSQLFRFGIPVAFAGMSGVILNHTDTMMLTYFRSLEEVGHYNVGYPTTKIITSVGVALTSVLLPMSSELWTRGKKEQIGNGLRLLYKYSMLFVFPVALLMFLFPGILLRILFGEEYVAASNVLRILSLSSIGFTLVAVNNSVISGIGKPGEVSKIMLTGAVLNLILNLTLIPAYGMEGASVATLIASVVMFSIGIKKLRSVILFNPPGRDLIFIILSGILVVILAYLIKSIDAIDIWSKLIIIVITGSIIYLSILILSKTLDTTEIKNILKRIR